MSKPSTYLAAFFGLTTVLAVGFALHERQVLAELQGHQNKIAAEEKFSAEKRLAEARRRVRELEAQLAQPAANALKDVQVTAAENGNSAENRTRGNGRRGARGPDVDLMLLESPEFAQVWTTQQRSQLDGRYADLFKSLKLAPEALDKFKNLMVDKQNSFRDVVAAARAEGLDPRENRDQIRQLVQQANEEIDRTIQATLGPDGFSQYKHYEQTLPQRALVSQIEQRLSYTSTPLNPSQSEQLIQILAQTSPTPSDERMGPRRGWGGPGSGATITEQTVAQAGAVLTPSQVAALQQLQSEQAAQQQMIRSLREQRENNARPPGSDPRTPAPRPPSPSG